MSLKRFLQSPAVQYLLGHVAALYVRGVLLTSKKVFEMHPDSEKLLYDGSVIYTFWHGQMLMAPGLKLPRKNTATLVSQHRDGRLIAQMVRRFGYQTIDGSSGKNGMLALRQMQQLLKEGGRVAITPDGPRGPAQQAAIGAAHVARASGKPLIPIAVAATPSRRLKTWDRFLIARPFGAIYYAVGAPIWPEGEKEMIRTQLEQRLNELTDVVENRAKAGA